MPELKVSQATIQDLLTGSGEGLYGLSPDAPLPVQAETAVRALQREYGASRGSVVSKIYEAQEPPPADLDFITTAAMKYNVDPDLIRAVIGVESNWDEEARSPKGAVGLMQILPSTAKMYGFEGSDLNDPVKNVEAGTQYLAYLIDKYGGDVSLALSAYNAGPGAVRKYGGIPPYKETQEYVRKVEDKYKKRK